MICKDNKGTIGDSGTGGRFFRSTFTHKKTPQNLSAGFLLCFFFEIVELKVVGHCHM